MLDTNVMSTLPEFPSPLLQDIIEDRCIPIIGAGFSKNAILPPGKVMPDWKTLGEYFAKEGGYDSEDPLDAISNFTHSFKRPKTIGLMRKLLHIDNVNVRPGRTHLSFARLPFTTVITTNFDYLLERAYTQIGKPFETIIEESQLAIDSVTDNRTTKILKIHGDFGNPKRLIITEEDYDTFRNEYPMMSTHIANLLITKTPLYIGYSLNDPDFRGIWETIRSRLGNNARQSYALVPSSTITVTTRFHRRGVEVIPI